MVVLCDLVINKFLNFVYWDRLKIVFIWEFILINFFIVLNCVKLKIYKLIEI